MVGYEPKVKYMREIIDNFLEISFSKSEAMGYTLTSGHKILRHRLQVEGSFSKYNEDFEVAPN